MAGITGRIIVDVRNIPELVWDLRHELADVLREEAGAEADPRVARRLREIAAAYEGGTRREAT